MVARRSAAPGAGGIGCVGRSTRRCGKGGFEPGQQLRGDGGPDAAHEPQVIGEVVDGVEPGPEDLVAAVEVTKVARE